MTSQCFDLHRCLTDLVVSRGSKILVAICLATNLATATIHLIHPVRIMLVPVHFCRIYTLIPAQSISNISSHSLQFLLFVLSHCYSIVEFPRSKRCRPHTPFFFFSSH